MSRPYGSCQIRRCVAENHPAHRPLSRHSVLCPMCTQPDCRATTCRGHRHPERDISRPCGWCETHHGVAENHPAHRPLSRHSVLCPICTQPECRATTCRARQHRHHGRDISRPCGWCETHHGVAEKHPPPVVGPRHVVAAPSATTAPQPFVVHCVRIILDNPFVLLPEHTFWLLESRRKPASKCCLHHL